VPGTAPPAGIELPGPDPAWPRQYDDLAGWIRAALGWRALQLDHVGSTAVPGLAAKPIIAASEANAGGEHATQYNARKQQIIREICR
jgi:GrpB protein